MTLLRPIGILLSLSIVSLMRPTLSQDRPKATLQGVVKLARNGEPFAGARVSLFSGSQPQDFRRTPLTTKITDSEGAFVFEGLDPGAYLFSVGNEGYARYNSAPILLSAGQTRNDVVVRIVQTGAVSGRVSSTSGKLLPEASVQLLRRTYDAN